MRFYNIKWLRIYFHPRILELHCKGVLNCHDSVLLPSITTQTGEFCSKMSVCRNSIYSNMKETFVVMRLQIASFWHFRNCAILMMWMKHIRRLSISFFLINDRPELLNFASRDLQICQESCKSIFLLSW